MIPPTLRQRTGLLRGVSAHPRIALFPSAMALLLVIAIHAQEQPPPPPLADYSVTFHTTSLTLHVTITREDSGFAVAQSWDNGLVITERLAYTDIKGIDPPMVNGVSDIWEAGLWIVTITGRQDAHFTEVRSDGTSASPQETTNTFLIPFGTQEEAQTTYQKLTKGWAVLRFLVHCQEGGSALACNSYNRMLQKQDKDIVGTVSDALSKIYVCFDSDSEDRFITVSFGLPLSTGWHKDERYKSSPLLVNYPTFLGMSVYTQGVLHDTRWALLRWTKFSQTADSLSGATVADVSSRPTDDTALVATVDSDQVSVQYGFTNLNNTTTRYMLQIRRSTDRFLETYDAPSGKAETQQITDSGECVDFGGQPK